MSNLINFLTEARDLVICGIGGIDFDVDCLPRKLMPFHDVLDCLGLGHLDEISFVTAGDFTMVSFVDYNLYDYVLYKGGNLVTFLEPCDISTEELVKLGLRDIVIRGELLFGMLLHHDFVGYFPNVEPELLYVWHDKLNIECRILELF